MSQPSKAMTSTTEATDLDSILEAYESAVAEGESVDLAQYLPPASDQSYFSVAVELIRVDMERSYANGSPKRLDDYREIAPRVFDNSGRLMEIAFEEYRLRLQVGERAKPSDYSTRLGIDTGDWPRADATHPPLQANGSKGVAESEGKIEPHRFASPFPSTGERFAGFQLIEELGRGAFGVVFLAHQYDLAGREVVLKITAPRSVEPQRLARLQHTNIVPIYSIHHDRGLLGICMPFLGRRTLADILKRRDEVSNAGSTLADRLDSTLVAPPRSHKSLISNDSAAGSGSHPILNEDRLSADSAIELVAQLAEGLGHAHGRGIVHSDLKPANVLIGDDTSALLLDFNLSDDANEYHRATLIVGGTLPYMAPEQLRGLSDGGRAMGSSDVFSLGVILFELLTGGRPFPTRNGTFKDTIEASIRDRAAPGLNLRSVSRSGAIGAIVAKCLEANPRDRYQSGNELADDLRRHQANMPLKHARERSIRERGTKWLRRNQRAVRLGFITALAAIAVCSSALFFARQSRLNKLDAAHAYSSFVEDVRTALLHLHIPGTEPELHAIGRNAAASALQEFGILSGNNLDKNSRFATLSDDQQKVVREQSAALRYSLSQIERDTRSAAAETDSISTLPAEHQAHELLAGDAGTMGQYLQALTLLENERYVEALPMWQKLSEADRGDSIRWFLLGNAYAGVGRLQDAESCYTAVIALQPRAVAAYFSRAMCRYDQANYEGARDDFSSILKLRPNLSTALINRALAYHSLRDHKQAEVDASAAIAAGLDDPRAYFVQALIRDALQDSNGAAADRARGFELPPKDDKGWMARGIACLASDAEKAREQFEQGLHEFPNSPGLLKNLVHVYSDRLQKPEKALPLIERLLARRPTDPTLLASRAVLNARLGDRSAAYRDAQQVAREPTTPLTSMQLACVYALTAKTNPDDSATAMRFVQAALARDPRLVVRIARDPDFEAVRSLPEYASLVGAAARLIGAPDYPTKPSESTMTQTGDQS